jgi:hypothetical protein
MVWVKNNQIFILLSSERSKRQTIQSNNNAQNLYVEYLAVIDSTVYSYFTQLYGNLNPPELLNDYINIFFSQIVNGVSKVLKKL